MSTKTSIDFVNFDFTCTMEACLSAFDKNSYGKLSFEEFKTLCEALFRDENGKTYDIKDDMVKEIFQIFDKNGDSRIDKEEFTYCWNKWIKTIVRPVSAILVIDVQNEFISGVLNISNYPAKHNGEHVVKPINELLDSVDFDGVYYSHDWHPSDHISYIDNLSLRKLDESSPISADKAQPFDTVIFAGDPPMPQRLFPRHCVENTWGSELHKDLKVVDNAVKIYKGTNSDIDSYSAFWDNMKLIDTKLDAQLRQKNITDVYVCGLAIDACVGTTASDASKNGFRTILLDDCSRGVDPVEIETTKNNVITNHGVVTTSHKVKAMVEGKDRRPELGYKLALELRKLNK